MSPVSFFIGWSIIGFVCVGLVDRKKWNALGSQPMMAQLFVAFIIGPISWAVMLVIVLESLIKKRRKT
jgi:uncharacterized membrane protein